MNSEIKNVLEKVENNEITENEAIKIIQNIKHTKPKDLQCNNFSNNKNNNIHNENSPYDISALLSQKLREIVSDLLELTIDRIKPETSLLEYGMESVAAVDFVKKIENMLDISLAPTILFEFNNINDLSTHLIQIYKDKVKDFIVKNNNLILNRHVISDMPTDIKNGEAVDNTITSTPVAIETVYSKADTAYSLIKPSTNEHLEVLWETARETFYNKKTDNSNLPTHSDFIPSYRLLIKTDTHTDSDVFIKGSGNEILFIGGLMTNYKIWANQIDFFSNNYRTLVYHPPGHGNSKLQQEHFSMNKILTSIQGTIDCLNITNPIHIIGWSLGGVIAQQLTIKYPNLAKSLILISTTSSSVNSPAGLFGNAYEDLVLPEPHQYWQQINEANEFDSEGFPLYRDLLNDFSITDIISAIQCPTLVLSGTHDPYMLTEYSLLIQKQIAGSEYHSIEGAAHFPHLTHSKILNKHISHFINSIPNQD